MRDLRHGPDVFDDTEEIGRLHDHRCGLVIQFAVEIFEIERARISLVLELVDGHALVQGICSQDLAVLGMQRTRNQDAVPARHADCHHGGFRDSG